jgi:hypothetical protein
MCFNLCTVMQVSKFDVFPVYVTKEYVGVETDAVALAALNSSLEADAC